MERIFINCPFDKEYNPILKSILFTSLALGYEPVLSTNKDSSANRLNGIIDLMKNSDYSIHDLSRIEIQRLPRFNMPFECGIDFGIKNTSNPNKKIMIFEKEQYRYQQVLSDISGNDIFSHKNMPVEAVKSIRNWVSEIKQEEIPTYTYLWYSYNDFESYLCESLNENKIPKKKWKDINTVTIKDLKDHIKKFLRQKSD